MTIRINKIVLVVFLVFTLNACISHYRYESRGEVTNAFNMPTSALLYWYADDGRLWYGPKYYQPDSNVEMNVCQAAPKQFSTIDSDQSQLILASRPGDFQVAEVASNGELIALVNPIRLPPDSKCGQISINGKIASTVELNQGVLPDIYILCNNPARVNRYPKVGRYAFNRITKTKVKENIPPRSVCQ